MRKASQRFAFAWLVIFALIPVHVFAAFIDQPVEISLDMDDDGTADRVVIVPDPESTDIDLSIYLGVGYGKLAPWGKPTFQRQVFRWTGRCLPSRKSARGRWSSCRAAAAAATTIRPR